MSLIKSSGTTKSFHCSGVFQKNERKKKIDDNDQSKSKDIIITIKVVMQHAVKGEQRFVRRGHTNKYKIIATGKAGLNMTQESILLSAGGACM